MIMNVTLGCDSDYEWRALARESPESTAEPKFKLGCQADNQYVLPQHCSIFKELPPFFLRTERSKAERDVRF